MTVAQITPPTRADRPASVIWSARRDRSAAPGWGGEVVHALGSPQEVEEAPHLGQGARPPGSSDAHVNLLDLVALSISASIPRLGGRC